jgi:hypothetical protein
MVEQLLASQEGFNSMELDGWLFNDAGNTETI